MTSFSNLRIAARSLFTVALCAHFLVACSSPRKEFETTVCHALELSKADARVPAARAKQAIRWLVDNVKTDKVKSAVGAIKYDGQDPAALGGLLREYNQEKIGADVGNCPFLKFLEEDVPVAGPVLSVDGMNILVMDKPAGSLDEAKLAKATAMPVRLSDLNIRLVFIREEWKMMHAPGEPFPGVLVLDVDPKLDDFYRRSIVFTANEAGFADLRKAPW